MSWTRTTIIEIIISFECLNWNHQKDFHDLKFGIVYLKKRSSGLWYELMVSNVKHSDFNWGFCGPLKQQKMFQVSWASFSQEVNHKSFLIACQWITPNSFIFLRCGGNRRSINSATWHCWKLSDGHSFDFTSVDLVLEEKLPRPIRSPLF